MKGFGNIFGRFLSILSARLLTTVISIASTPIIVRLLGPGGYGDYAVMLSIFSLYMIPVSSGITEGVQKFVAEAREMDHWQENVIRFYGVLAVGMVSVAALVLLAVTASGLAESIFGTEFTLYFYLLVGYVVVSQMRALVYHVVLGFGLEPISGPLSVVKKFVTVSVGIGLVTVGYGVSGMLIGHIGANLVVALSAAYVIAKRISLSKLIGGTPDAFPYRELLSFNVLNIVLILLVTSMFHVDVIMLRTLVGSETTGFYKGALAIAEYVWLVPIALQTVLLHSASTLWSENRTAAITDFASRITRYTVLLVLLMAIGLAALAEAFVPLYYGDPFSAAIFPLLLLLPGVVGFAGARPLQAISQGSGKIKILIVATGGAAGLNLVLNAVLIPIYGMNGAAVATSVGYASMFGFLVWAAWRIGYDPLDDFRPLRILATGAVSAPPILLLADAIGSDVVALVVVPPIGAVVYLLAAVLLGAIDTGEITEIVRKFPLPIGSSIGSGTSWVEK